MYRPQFVWIVQAVLSSSNFPGTNRTQQNGSIRYLWIRRTGEAKRASIHKNTRHSVKGISNRTQTAKQTGPHSDALPQAAIDLKTFFDPTRKTDIFSSIHNVRGISSASF